MTLQKIKRRLADRSEVFDVRMSEGDNRLDFACVTERDADSLVAKIAAAVKEHTVEEAECV